MFKTSSLEYIDRPIDSPETLAKDILRPVLYAILQQADSIQRLTGLGLLPSSIQGETVKAHTIRLVALANILPGNEKTKNALMLTLAIHDLPETGQLIAVNRRSDTTAVDKALSAELDQQISVTEEQVATNIFNSDELNLYHEFEKASSYLKGRSQDLPTEIGLISKICDKIDADIHYHMAAIANRNDWSKLCDKGPKLGFDLYEAYSTKLVELKNTSLSNSSILCQELMNSTMLKIQEIWNEVPQNEVPQIIKECLENFKMYSI